MSPEERQLLAGLFDRIKSNSAAPRDAEAEAFIADQVKALPSAPYLLAQTVIVQDFALQQANKKLEELETRAREQQAKPATSFLGGLFGGGSRPPEPPRPAPQQGYPQPGYAPPQGGPWGAGAPQQGYAAPQAGVAQGGFAPQAAPQQGGGFLKGALGTAAGVAGGVLLADSIRGLFHGGGVGSGLGIDPGFGHAGFGGGETIINNYYETPNQQDASYDAGYDDGGPQDADFPDDGGSYGDDGGFDSGGDGGFDV